MEPITPKPKRWRLSDRSLQVAAGLWLALALFGPLYVDLPGVGRGDADIVFLGSAVAISCAALIALLPQRVCLRFLYPLGVALALGVLASSVAATGGASSPLRAFALFYVVFAAWFLSCRAASPVLLATVLVNLLPLLYSKGALAGAPLGWTMILTCTFVASGAAIVAVRHELRTSTALDAERLKTIVALHREVERAAFDVQGVVLDILDRARVLLGASAASAGIIEGQEIVYKYRTGPGRDSGVAIRTPRDASLSGICLDSGEAVYCEDSELDPRVDKAACRKQRLRSMIIVPLRHRGEVVGVLNVNSPEVRAFDANDVRTVQLTAGAISAAYGHAVDLAVKQGLLDDLKESESKLSHQALHDALTGLPNRRLCLQLLQSALAEPGGHVAVLFVDLDDFKVVNDNLGHGVGDALLIQAAQRISGALRQGDTAARLGGDEFVVICRNVSPPAAAVRVAERLTAGLAAPFRLTGRDAYISASVGIAAHEGTPEELLRDADVRDVFRQGRWQGTS